MWWNFHQNFAYSQKKHGNLSFLMHINHYYTKSRKISIARGSWYTKLLIIFSATIFYYYYSIVLGCICSNILETRIIDLLISWYWHFEISIFAFFSSKVNNGDAEGLLIRIIHQLYRLFRRAKLKIRV